ncbi:MAG: homogentisate 1,2-dioxygenase [Bacteroidetes bacterium CG2_30_33_31]|nr:MAG: homogentisate 1,2-dioxygenase [Bacteroidetes bacterium CG2_30_33_31]
MARYHKIGKLPLKRHIAFCNADGSLYPEQLISSEGFSSDYSLTYHTHRPTLVLDIEKTKDIKPNFVDNDLMVNRSFQGFDIEPKDDFLDSRTAILGNDEILISLAAPRKSMKDYFYKNSQAWEMIFIHQGEGLLKSMFGSIKFNYGDQIIIPKGVIFQLNFKTSENRLFIVESTTPYRFPKKYLNSNGQLLEHSPIYERDIKLPENLETHEELGDFKVVIKRDNKLYPYHYQAHPFDLVGWDGCYYPYAFSIHDFSPITGKLHLPPPIHQTWECDGAVLCAFVPRLYDYHENSVPAPYNHANIDSDEVLYYVDGEFMSRNNIAKGQITLHPMGVVHGPHPGAAERSIGKKETQELAVMVDTFRPLKMTAMAAKIEVKDYYKSWLENNK